jgi:hypothetical protein
MCPLLQSPTKTVAYNPARRGEAPGTAKERAMRIRNLSILSALLALVIVTAFPRAAAAQPRTPDPYEILEASSSAMSEVQAARFTGSMDMQAASGGSSTSMAIALSGEYRAPDRMRITMDLGNLLGALMDPSMSGPFEMLMVGETVWMRMGSQPWESMSSGMGSAQFGQRPAPNMHQSMAMTGRYIPNAVLVDAGPEWEIRGDLDLMAAMQEGMAMSSMMGMGMPSASMPGMSPSDMAMVEQMNARFSMRINKSTHHMEQMRVTMDLPDPSGSGTVAITVDLVFSDYNSPSIQINPPM